VKDQEEAAQEQGEVKPSKGLLTHLQQPDQPRRISKTLRLEQEELQRAARVTALLVENDRDTLILPPEVRNAIPQTDNLYGYAGKAASYRPLPECAIESPVVLLAFRIELHPLRSSSTPIGIELLGDVILGMDRKDHQKPDLDLSDYTDNSHGVSRRHAMIRPTAHRLYLLDLQSTNGTMHNALPITSGNARELHDGDIITLGSLSFAIRIVSVGGPSM
jgi:hypothetical protein